MTVNLYHGTNRISETIVLYCAYHGTAFNDRSRPLQSVQSAQYSSVQYKVQCSMKYSTVLSYLLLFGTMIPKRIYECSTMVPLHQTAIGLQSRLQSGRNHNRPFADRAFYSAFAIAIAIDDCGFRFPQTGVVCNRRLQSIPQSQNAA